MIPTQTVLVLERFFDESGGMQLVLHAPYGSRINRAWGLALRKRFCRKFNFELQAAATEDAVVLSLGTQHSFPLEEVFRYLRSDSVRHLLVQAVLDSPMFALRWRWNATRSLALPRQRGSRKIPAPLQRMDAENLLAAVFPDQLACLENISGDREIPDHPLVEQTIKDCLNEAMDIEGLIAVLRRIEQGAIRLEARDLPEPSPFSQEVLNARPYAFLDDAPLEERRTRAVYTRRTLEFSSMSELGRLDEAAIETVRREAWPVAENPDEFHEALLGLGMVSDDEAARVAGDVVRAQEWLAHLTAEARARRVRLESWSGWTAAEQLADLNQVFPGLAPAEGQSTGRTDRAEIIRELVRGRLESSGPISDEQLAEPLRLSRDDVRGALSSLEAEGFVLRGRFSNPPPADLEWCERRLLARIHRLTVNRLRAEIQPVSLADFSRFLFAWQRADAEHRSSGPGGLAELLEILNGFELPAAAWEPEVLAPRLEGYDPRWLDQLFFAGKWVWGRLRLPTAGSLDSPIAGPVPSCPTAIFKRDQLESWLSLTAAPQQPALRPEPRTILELLAKHGPMFFGDLAARGRLLPSRLEKGLGELAALGLVTSDGFEGLRVLITPERKKKSFGWASRRGGHLSPAGIEFAGRWSLLRGREDGGFNAGPGEIPEPHFEIYARALLRRYGVCFRRLLEREAFPVAWYALGRTLRRLEARGEIRGGHFVSGMSGEQFALPEAIPMLRAIRKSEPKNEWINLSAADPLNLGLFSGAKIPATRRSRILFRDGLPAAALIGGEASPLEPGLRITPAIEQALRVGRLPPALQPYYG